MTKTICHLSVLHFRYDLRIVIRECASLVNAGYNVHYILSDGRGNEMFKAIHIHDLGSPCSLLKRLTKTHYKCLRKALKIDADVYHFHDPELMPLAVVLKLLGKKVIADIHEDVPSQFKGNHRKSVLKRNLGFLLVSYLEKWTLPFFDGVITASPYVENKLRFYAKKIINIGCFPDLRTEFYNIEKEDKLYDLVYAGSISTIRGIGETLDVIEGTNHKFALAGDFQGKGIEGEIKRKKAWKKNTTYLGYIENRQDYTRLLMRSKIGMTTLQDNLNFRTIYCVKMFEYMAAGIPQITTNFEQWKEWFEVFNCMVFVDPQEKEEIQNAIDTLLDDEKKLHIMGRNGRKAIEERFNWASEELRLYEFYETILDQKKQ